MASPQVSDGSDNLQVQIIAANILNKHFWRAEKGQSFRFGLDMLLTTPHYKK
jgi:hypothetical protein